MSLLKKPEVSTRWKKLLLVVVTLLLLVPSAGAVVFAMRFDVETNVQEPTTQERERQEKEKVEIKRRRSSEATGITIEESDPRVREERERKERMELEMRDVRQAALVRLAKINMDQAIQIATSQQPGKVLFCSLEASRWEEPGKLAKDGFVFYRVIIANEVEGGVVHVWVNAIDGTTIKVEKEGPRKLRTPE
jgi:uncharacterized membrane protein YkoI